MTFFVDIGVVPLMLHAHRNERTPIKHLRQAPCEIPLINRVDSRPLCRRLAIWLMGLSWSTPDRTRGRSQRCISIGAQSQRTELCDNDFLLAQHCQGALPGPKQKLHDCSHGKGAKCVAERRALTIGGCSASLRDSHATLGQVRAYNASLGDRGRTKPSSAPA